MKFRLLATPVVLALLAFSGPSELVASEVYVSHSLRLFEEDNFFSQWQDLNDEQRAQRSEAILAWLDWVGLFGTDLLVDAPDTPLAAFDQLIPDPSKPAMARTVDLDQMIGIFNKSGLNIVLEIRPTSGALVPPENQITFVKRVKSLVERYDGDTDFGIDTPFATDELPYPDINESWVVSSADLDGTSDEQKVAFAESHVVEAYSLCAGLDLTAADLESHSAWVSATAKGIRLANSQAKIFAGPFRLSQMKKGLLDTLLGAVLQQSPGSLTGIFVDVDTPISSMELGGGDLETSFTNIRSVLKLIGGEDLELIVVGNHVPSRAYAANQAWVRPCPEDALCNEDIQGQLLVKTLLRARAKGNGIGVAAPIGFLGNDDTPGPLATVATSWVDDHPVVNGSGMAWIRIVKALIAGDHRVTELNAPVQNVRMIRIGDNDVNQTLVVWYDWYRESAPGQPYSGIQKSIKVAVPEGALESHLTQLNADVETSIVALPDEIYEGEHEVFAVDEFGEVKVTLEDQLVVLRFFAEVAVADVPPGELIGSPDAGAGVSDFLHPEEPGPEGCQSEGGAAPWWTLVLVLSLMGILRRKRTNPTP